MTAAPLKIMRGPPNAYPMVIQTGPREEKTAECEESAFAKYAYDSYHTFMCSNVMVMTATR